MMYNIFIFNKSSEKKNDYFDLFYIHLRTMSIGIIVFHDMWSALKIAFYVNMFTIILLIIELYPGYRFVYYLFWNSNDKTDKNFCMLVIILKSFN